MNRFKELATNISNAEIGFLAYAQDITGCSFDEAKKALGNFKEQGLIELCADCGHFSLGGSVTDIGAILNRMQVLN